MSIRLFPVLWFTRLEDVLIKLELDLRNRSRFFILSVKALSIGR